MPWGPTHNPQEKEAARRAEAAEQQRLDALMEMERIRALEAYAVRGGVGGGETAECVCGGGGGERGRQTQWRGLGGRGPRSNGWVLLQRMWANRHAAMHSWSLATGQAKHSPCWYHAALQRCMHPLSGTAAPGSLPSSLHAMSTAQGSYYDSCDPWTPLCYLSGCPRPQARDQQRLHEQKRCASILQQQLDERRQQKQAAEEMQDQVSRGCQPPTSKQQAAGSSRRRQQQRQRQQGGIGC
jgi:hypothetical protein